MVLDIIAGVFFGILTGMGIGGGGLLVLYLTGVSGVGQLQAQGCNLLFFVFASVSALFIHNKKRRLDFRLIGISALLALIGAQIGVRLTGILPEELIRHMFGWMLILAGSISGGRVVFGILKERNLK